jgi:hypothetical protein
VDRKPEEEGSCVADLMITTLGMSNVKWIADFEIFGYGLISKLQRGTKGEFGGFFWRECVVKRGAITLNS